MSEADLLVTTVIELFKIAHQQLRTEIADLHAAALNWTPGPETNSIGTLITHTCGSENEVLHSVRGLPVERDRDAEFTGQGYDRAALLARLDAADAALERVGRPIGAADLATLRTRPNGDGARLGLYWLLRSYGHTREHLAHVQLTRQLYQAAQAKEQQG